MAFQQGQRLRGLHSPPLSFGKGIDAFQKGRVAEVLAMENVNIRVRRALLHVAGKFMFVRNGGKPHLCKLSPLCKEAILAVGAVHHHHS